MVRRWGGKGLLAGAGGLVMGVTSMAVASVYPQSTLAVALLALFAAVLLGWSFMSEFEAFRSFSRKRSTHLRLNNALMAVIFVFIIVLVNLIARQYYLRLDYSTEGRFTLAPQSKAVAKSISDVVTVRYFGHEASRESERMRELMESYRYLNRNIIYELFDLDSSPVLAGKYDIKEYGSLAVESAAGVFTDRGAEEETITNLLIRATLSREKVVRYLSGHGERDFESTTDRGGYGLLGATIRSMGYRLEPLNLLAEGAVPIGTDLLIIAAPATGLAEAEFKMLEAYRASGGKFIVLNEGPGPMDGFLASLGVKMHPWPIYDEQNVAGADPSSPLVIKYYSSPVTDGFSLSTIFPGVYEVARSDRHTGFSITPLVLSSRDSWYEKNGDGRMQEDEEEGFSSLVVTVGRQDELMKVIIIGDSDFVSNAYYTTEGNINLFMNALNWLVGEGRLTSMAPRSRTVIPMYITDEQSRLIRLLVSFGIPALIIIVGTVMFLKRRAL